MKLLVTIGVAGCLLGCARPPLSGPPETRLGRDECAECGMLVTEDRFSSAMIVERDGERLYAHFDDIGCMLDFERDKGGSVHILDRFVRDHASRSWVPASDAAFLFADHKILRTPMGSGIAAFSTQPAALLLKDQVGGEVIDLESLVEVRRSWMESRYGSPQTPQR